MRVIRKLIGNRKGATAIEYSLVATLIAVAAIAAFLQLGGQVRSTYNNVSECVAGSTSC
jgi:pilus assembly protein Flp/PilA